MAVRIGYKASAEQFDPATLLEYAVEAERSGLDIVAVSDHFQPWRHTGGHSPAALPWLGAVGQSTDRVLLGTSVLTPTLRYHPSVWPRRSRRSAASPRAASSWAWARARR